jgi:predicted GIY-YIG superfamily endonuclease
MLTPGMVITLENWFYVYELIDDHGLVFYVGVSSDPSYRFRSHANPKHCDRAIICQTIAEQTHPTMRIVSAHRTRREAEAAESQRILDTPGLLNERLSVEGQGESRGKTEAQEGETQREASKP